MNERTKQFRVGVVVLFTILLFCMLVLWNSNFSALPFRPGYEVKMVVDEAPGIAKGTPVRRHGLPIGRVDKIEDSEAGAVLTLKIDDGKQIKDNEIGRIQTSLVGDAVIEIVPKLSKGPIQPVPPGGQITGMYSPNPMDLLANLQADLKQTIISLGDAGREVSKLANQLNQVLGDRDTQRVGHLVDSMEDAMTQFATVSKNLNDIVGDEELKKQLKQGMKQLPSFMNDAQSILQSLDRVATSADQNLKNLTGLTQPLGDRGPQIVDAMERSVRNLQELLAEVALLSKNLNNSDGTLGLLIRDRKLYDQLSATLTQASGTIGDARMLVNDPEIQRRIREILYNAWVFTDKLARDPARLARGVLKPETPIK